jgi:dTDP-glucose 4,6-dehydratase
MTQTWLVTGGAGFIGRAVVRSLLAGGDRVVVLDAMTYAAHPAALHRLSIDDRLTVVEGDVADPEAVAAVLAQHRPAFVLNLAAHSHVDRSLDDAAPFIHASTTGAWVVARATLEIGARLVQVSTDEVYGDRHGRPAAVEGDPSVPTNPYSAAKAAGDAMVQSLVRSHGLDAVVTRGVNTYGPGQYPEKLLPLAGTRWRAGQPMGVYGDGTQRRDWLHVDDHAAGILAAATRAETGSVVHLAGTGPQTNLEVLEAWWSALGRPAIDPWWEAVADRAGHDRRYDLDDSASRSALGWAPRLDLCAGLTATARWWRDNPDFWGDAG